MREIKLFNTLTGKKELFSPIEESKIRMYSCGLTVYNYGHIGNFRTFILTDLLRRVFEYFGFEVNQVVNITDVDDKTIKKSKEENVPLRDVTSRYEKAFFEDLQTLNILHPHLTPRATENIKEMITLIEKLLEKQVAYKSSDGIYFDISKSDDYGALAHLDLHKVVKERIANDEYDKENARDFALWKFHTEVDSEVFYEAPFGKGRPGWHIECSAMSMAHLGETLDVHIGGSDLIFPHHTNEIAQSEAATGKKFVNYWVHGSFITIEGEKMSKSLGNIFLLSDLKNRGIHPLSFRYFTLGAKYNSLLNFTWEAVLGAQNAYEKILNNYTELPKSDNSDASLLEKFEEAISDDLNTPVAIALLQEAGSKSVIKKMDEVLGLNIEKLSHELESHIPDEISDLKSERDTSRKQKEWGKSDNLRKEIEKEGYVLEDRDGTSKIRKTLASLV